MEWAGPKEESIGLWNLLWQIILAKELALCLIDSPDAWYSGFTSMVPASLIIQDLWFRNVEIILTDCNPLKDNLKKPQIPEEQAKAEEFKYKGNEAMRRSQ